jgi:hypothetical protein
MIRALRQIALDKNADPKTRLQAAERVLELTGEIPASKEVEKGKSFTELLSASA